jgi:plasmid stability protein
MAAGDGRTYNPAYRLQPVTYEGPAMSEYRASTIRLPEDVADELRVAAEISGRSVNAEVLVAVRNHLACIRRTPAFQEGVQQLLRRNQALLRRLG